jgi:NAD-dependent deacetylase
MRRAAALTLSCDLFRAIGSSRVVRPAAGVPPMATRNGARPVILDRDATAFDDIAGGVIHQDIGRVPARFVGVLIRGARYPAR